MGWPSIAADQFYTAIKGRDYATAYSYLGAELRHGLSQQTFAKQAQARDAADGQVVKFAYTTVPIGDPAKLTLDVTRGDGSTYVVHLVLHQESGAWEVTAFDSI